MKRSHALFIVLVGLVTACSDARPKEVPDVDSASSPPAAADDTALAPVTQTTPADDVNTEQSEPEGEGGSDSGAETPVVVEAPAAGAGGAGVTAVDNDAELAGGAGGASNLPVGGEGGATITLEPSCAGLLDGSYCGDLLSSPGALTTLYLCKGGAVSAISDCPGGCKGNACVDDTSTSGGSNHESGELCKHCLADHCLAESALCAAQGDCAPLEECRNQHCSNHCD